MSESVQNSKPKSKKPIFKKWWFWVIIVFIIIGVSSSQSANKNATKVGENGSTSQNSEQTKFKVGDVIAFDGKQITVTSVDRNYSTGNDYIKPSDGKEFIKVNVIIENKSDDKVSYNVFDWKVQDSNGAIESQTGNAIMANPSDNLGSGDLAKGGKKSGSIVFEVPSGDAGLILHYQPSFWSDKAVEITV